MFVLREHYEPEIAYVESALAPGMVVIDGGANLGIYTVLASRVVGDSGCVLAFEPGETSFRSLQNNVALNGAHNVRTFKRALSNVSGRARLYHSGGGLVSYSIFPEDGSAGEFEEIETTTIDDTLAAERIDRVDFLKLDVEGAEELALRGAEQLLSRVHPIVMFEMQPGAPTPGDAAHSGAWALLERIGYELYAVADDHTLLPLAAPRAGNNLALPKVGDVLSHAAIKFRLRQIDG
jgi:FkbM family methyltransferase